jgi:hypothetical protein
MLGNRETGLIIGQPAAESSVKRASELQERFDKLLK